MTTTTVPATTAETIAQLTNGLRKANTAIARLEQIVLRRSLTAEEMDYFAAKFPDVVATKVATQAATTVIKAAPVTAAPAPSADPIVNGYYFNEKTGAAVAVRDGTAFVVGIDGKRTDATTRFDGAGFEYIGKGALPNVLAKKMREAGATISKALAPVARVAQAAAAVASAAPAPSKKVAIANMTSAQLRDAITEYGGDVAKVLEGWHKDQQGDAMRYWLQVFRQTARANGGKGKLARAAAYAALNS